MTPAGIEPATFRFVAQHFNTVPLRSSLPSHTGSKIGRSLRPSHLCACEGMSYVVTFTFTINFLLSGVDKSAY